MHSNHMHLNFYVCYRLNYKLLLAGGSASEYNALVSGIFTSNYNSIISANNWWHGSA